MAIVHELAPEIFASIAILGVSFTILGSLRGSRKTALSNIISNNARGLYEYLPPMLEEIYNLSPDERHVFLSKPISFRDFVRGLIWTNQRLERVVDLNNRIAADAVLRLPAGEIENIAKSTTTALELSTALSYALERLSSGDKFAYSYENGVTYESREEFFSSIINDLVEAEIFKGFHQLREDIYVVLDDLDASNQMKSRLTPRKNAHRRRRRPFQPSPGERSFTVEDMDNDTPVFIRRMQERLDEITLNGENTGEVRNKHRSSLLSWR